MATEDERKLFVAGLPESMTEDVLRGLFEATGGKVLDVSLPRHRDTGRPRGFGFVTMSSGEEATKARGDLDGSMQSGRAISVRPFQSGPPKREARTGGGGAGAAQNQGADRTLYVGNLPYDATPKEVEELIQNAGSGPVVRIHLPTGPDGRLRGFGFVTMGSSEAANEAIVALRAVELRGRRLMVNIAHPRGEKSGERPERPPRREAPADAEPRSFDQGPPPPDPPNWTGKPEGRRDRWDRQDKEKKKKKKRGARTERDGAAGKRRQNNPRQWEDWDDD